MTNQQPEQPQLEPLQALRILHEAARLAPIPYQGTVNVEIAAQQLGQFLNEFQKVETKEMPPMPMAGETETQYQKRTKRGRRSSNTQPEEVDI